MLRLEAPFPLLPPTPLVRRALDPALKVGLFRNPVDVFGDVFGLLILLSVLNDQSSFGNLNQPELVSPLISLGLCFELFSREVLLK